MDVSMYLSKNFETILESSWEFYDKPNWKRICRAQIKEEEGTAYNKTEHDREFYFRVIHEDITKPSKIWAIVAQCLLMLGKCYTAANITLSAGLFQMSFNYVGCPLQARGVLSPPFHTDVSPPKKIKWWWGLSPSRGGGGAPVPYGVGSIMIPSHSTHTHIQVHGAPSPTVGGFYHENSKHFFFF